MTVAKKLASSAGVNNDTTPSMMMAVGDREREKCSSSLCHLIRGEDFSDFFFGVSLCVCDPIVFLGEGGEEIMRGVVIEFKPHYTSKVAYSPSPFPLFCSIAAGWLSPPDICSKDPFCFCRLFVKASARGEKMGSNIASHCVKGKKHRSN